MATYLHKTRTDQIQSEAASESEAEFSPWTSAAPTDSEPDLLDESEVEEAVKSSPPEQHHPHRQPSSRLRRHSSSRPREAHSSSSRRGSTDLTPGTSPPGKTFTRLDPSVYAPPPSRSEGTSPSLLAASLQQHRDEPWPPARAPSGASFGAAASTPGTATKPRSGTLTRSMQLPTTSAVAISGAQPQRRRRGVRHTPPSSSLNADRAVDVESEPDDPHNRQADETFVELLDAARAFMSLAPSGSGSGKTPPVQVSAQPAAAGAVHGSQHEVKEEEEAAAAVAGEEAGEQGAHDSAAPSIPTSFNVSRTSSEVGDTLKPSPLCEAEVPSRAEEAALGWSGWLAHAIQMRVWHALALASVAFGAGYSLACLYHPLRLKIR